MRPTRGLTLVEICVSMFCLSILLLVAVQLLFPAMRAWTDGQRRSELGQGVLVTSNWLGDDIVRSSPDSIKLTDEGVLVMRCALGQQEDHTNEFTELVAYWMEGTDLYRSHVTLAAAETETSEPTLEELAGFDSKRKVASGVEIFEVTVVQPWRADIHLKVAKEGRSAEIFTSYSSIYAPLDPKSVEPTPAPSS